MPNSSKSYRATAIAPKTTRPAPQASVRRRGGGGSDGSSSSGRSSSDRLEAISELGQPTLRLAAWASEDFLAAMRLATNWNVQLPLGAQPPTRQTATEPESSSSQQQYRPQQVQQQQQQRQ